MVRLKRTGPGHRDPRNRWIAVLIGGILLGLAIWYLPVQDWLQHGLAWVEQLGWWGVLGFIVLYVVATICLVPAWTLTLGAGAVFGVGWGSLYVSLASTLGATGAFLLGRFLFRDWVQRRLRSNAKFEALDRAVGREGWRIVLLTRLSPVIPFNLLNYFLGLTRVPLWHYILTSWIGMMPGTVLYVYLGSLTTAISEERSRAEWILYGVGLLATIVVVVHVTRLARRALSGSLQEVGPDDHGNNA